jgi:ribosomal protein S18 acetylase RimI-like enzyme
VNQARPGDLYVDQIAVDPAWRGGGVTKLLLDCLEAEARKRRCTRLWLSTDPANPAIRAWPSLGFVELGLHKDFKGAGKDRALFEKRLD